MYAKTFLDGNAMRSLYRIFRELTYRIVGQTGQRIQGRFLQDVENDFPCNTTGMRSAVVPNSVHRLRPGKRFIHLTTHRVHLILYGIHLLR